MYTNILADLCLFQLLITSPGRGNMTTPNGKEKPHAGADRPENKKR